MQNRFFQRRCNQSMIQRPQSLGHQKNRQQKLFDQSDNIQQQLGSCRFGISHGPRQRGQEDQKEGQGRGQRWKKHSSNLTFPWLPFFVSFWFDSPRPGAMAEGSSKPRIPSTAAWTSNDRRPAEQRAVGAKRREVEVGWSMEGSG